MYDWPILKYHDIATNLKKGQFAQNLKNGSDIYEHVHLTKFKHAQKNHFIPHIKEMIHKKITHSFRIYFLLQVNALKCNLNFQVFLQVKFTEGINLTSDTT